MKALMRAGRLRVRLRCLPARAARVAALVVVSVFAALSLVTAAGVLLGSKPVVVVSGSMAPALRPGDVVLFEAVPEGGPADGTIVLVERPGSKPLTHRVTGRDADGRLIVQGDANAHPDADPVPLSAVRGTAELVVPLVGRLRLLGTENWTGGLTAATVLAGAAMVLGAVPLRRLRPRRPGLRRRPVFAHVPRLWPMALAPVLVVAIAPAGAAFTARTYGLTDRLAAAASFPLAYSQEVLNDTPDLYYRMAEASGTQMTDASTHNRHGTYGYSVYGGDQRKTGAISDGDQSTRFNGDGAYLATPTQVNNPNTYSLEVWIRTTTTTGGRILGLAPARFGNLNPGTPPSWWDLGYDADRMLYLSDTGNAVFMNRWGGGDSHVQSSGVVNDGNWHHIVATANPATQMMRLYVDGAEQTAGIHRFNADGIHAQYVSGQNYAGYWRLGSHLMAPETPMPTTMSVTADLDEAAVYHSVLTPARISAHYAARTGAGYPAAVQADSPFAYYRLSDATNSATDSSGNNRTGVHRRGMLGAEAPGATGPSGANAGMQTTLSTDDVDHATNVAVSDTQFNNPQAFTIELWFQTRETTKASVLAEFGDQKNDPDILYHDRVLGIKKDGTVTFVVYNGTDDVFYTVNSAAGFNDGQWHHAVATYSSATGLRLYVDGTLIGPVAGAEALAMTGYWRFGSGTVWNWYPDSNLNDGEAHALEGALDEVAIYHKVLTGARVTAHYNARNR